MEAKKPSRLNALTGLRTFAALNLVFYHFANPEKFGLLTPIVSAGYASVAFFIQLSGFVLAYNYARQARAGKLSSVRFWKARFARLYPIYFLSLVLSYFAMPYFSLHYTKFEFWAGMVLTPLLLQGWIPQLCTFLNIPAWTMSAEAFFYVLFPWLASWKMPTRVTPHLAKMAWVWCLGMVPGLLYMVFNPDGLTHLDGKSDGLWLSVFKYSPVAHVMSFVFGVMLASVDELVDRAGRLRIWVGLGGFAGLLGVLELGNRVPYAIIHDGLLMPLFGCIILGLAGINWLAKIFSLRPLVFVGNASYCVYLFQYSFWHLIHYIPQPRLHAVIESHPRDCCVLVVAMALVVQVLVQKPAQKILRVLLGVDKPSKAKESSSRIQAPVAVGGTAAIGLAASRTPEKSEDW